MSTEQDLMRAASMSDYEQWYDEAIVASNELGYACMSAADVIRMMGEELKAARQQAAVLPKGWRIERISKDVLKVSWGGSGVVVDSQGAMSVAVAGIALYELATAMLTAAPQAEQVVVPIAEVVSAYSGDPDTKGSRAVKYFQPLPPVGTKLFAAPPTPDVGGYLTCSVEALQERETDITALVEALETCLEIEERQGVIAEALAAISSANNHKENKSE